MLCGMFGKLPSKRDFVSYNMPRPFLEKWEEWLQSGIAASRFALDAQWQELFLTVPIWHFWFGTRVHGIAATGALMPSVDGVGRYFPLTLCACEPEEAALPPPASAEILQWHEQAAAFLLHMLDDDLADEPAALLERLAFAPLRPRAEAPRQVSRGFIWEDDPGSSLDAAFAGLEALTGGLEHSDKSYWWTRGGGAHRAQLVAITGRAEPQFVTGLMTGQFT